MVMMMRSKRAVVGVSHWTVLLGQHHNFVVFFTEKGWRRGNTNVYQRLLKCNAWAFELR